MKLLHIPASHVDIAWRDGACRLSEACATSGGEVTGDQLKMILSRGERNLIRMDEEGVTTGWGVVRIDQLPNMRVLFVTDLYAPGCGFERFFSELRAMAQGLGCSRIRCAAKPAQSRLYQSKVGAKPVYEILEWEMI